MRPERQNAQRFLHKHVKTRIWVRSAANVSRIYSLVRHRHRVWTHLKSKSASDRSVNKICFSSDQASIRRFPGSYESCACSCGKSREIELLKIKAFFVSSREGLATPGGKWPGSVIIRRWNQVPVSIGSHETIIDMRHTTYNLREANKSAILQLEVA